jgi:hypothetical protein
MVRFLQDLKASTGSRFAARRAGAKPEINPIRYRQTDSSSYQRDQKRFKQELGKDEPFFGPDSHFEADFFGSFLDNDVHDVGHTDAPYDKSKGPDNP